MGWVQSSFYINTGLLLYSTVSQIKVNSIKDFQSSLIYYTHIQNGQSYSRFVGKYFTTVYAILMFKNFEYIVNTFNLQVIATIAAVAFGQARYVSISIN